MKTKITLNLFIVFVCLKTVLLAQTGGPITDMMFDNHIASIKYSYENLIDLYTGDFQFDLPLFELKLRGGKTIPFSAKYQSGIKMGQVASWIGLGWHFSPGKIMRSIRGVPDDFRHCYVEKEQVGEFTNFSLSQSLTGLPWYRSICISWERTRQHTKDDIYYYGYLYYQCFNDEYYFDPNITFSDEVCREQSRARMHMNFSGNLTMPYFLAMDDYYVTGFGPQGKIAPYRDGAQAHLFYDDEPVEPINNFIFINNDTKAKVNYITDSDGLITGFIVTDIDGTRYVYGYPVFNNSGQVGIGYKDFGVTNNNYTKHTYNQKYALEWQLTAILYPDFIDNGTKFDGRTVDTDGNWLGLDYNDDGNWIYFKYSLYNDVYNWRVPESSTRISSLWGVSSSDSKHEVSYGSKQLVYLTKIQTPINEVRFEIDQFERQDALEIFSNGTIGTDKPAALSKITVYNYDELNNGRGEIWGFDYKINFHYDHSLCTGSPNSTSGNGKLTLTDVEFIRKEDYCMTLSEHCQPSRTISFEYNDDPNWDNIKWDRWGYYNNNVTLYNHKVPQIGYNDEYVRSWSLNKINFHSGGYISINYESDSYHKVFNLDPQQGISSDLKYGGGPRVKYLKMNDGHDTVNYRIFYSRNDVCDDFSFQTNRDQSSGVAEGEPEPFCALNDLDTRPWEWYPFATYSIGYEQVIVVPNAVQKEEAGNYGHDIVDETDGRIIYEFTAGDEIPDIYTYNSSTYEHYRENNSWKRGKVKGIRYGFIDKTTDQFCCTKEITNQYQNLETEYLDFDKVSWHDQNFLQNVRVRSDFVDVIGGKAVVKTKSESLDGVETTTNITYSKVNGMPVSISTTNSDNDLKESQAVYAFQQYKTGLVPSTTEDYSPIFLASWRFEESQGTIVKDYINPINTGDMHGAAWEASGKIGYCLNFDGIDDYVSIRRSPEYNVVNTLSIEAWICPDSTNSSRTIISKRGAYDLRIDSGYLKIGVQKDNNFIWYGSQVLISADVWSHIVVTLEGSIYKIYKNGVLEQTLLTPGNSTDIWDTGYVKGIWIGAHEEANSVGSSFFQGKIDEVSLYNKVLTLEDVSARYNSGAGKHLSGMDAKYMLSPVYSGIILTNNNKFLSKLWTKWCELGDSFVMDEDWIWKGQDDVAQVPSNPGENYTLCTNIYNKYDEHKNIIETTDANLVKTTQKWGYDGALNIATIKNAINGECSFLNLEDGWSDWTSGNSDLYRTTSDLVPNNQVHSGIYSAYCSTASSEYGPTLNMYIGSDGIDINKNYIFEAWVNIENGEVNIGADARNAQGQSIAGIGWYNSISTGDGWQLLTVEITSDLMSSLTPGCYLQCFCGFPNSGSSGYVDDLRFYPKNSLMTTQTFDLWSYNLSCYMDENNIPSFAEYDNFGLLKTIKNSNYDILKSISYSYSRDNNSDLYNVADPNKVIETLNFDDVNQSVKSVYYDGFGKSIQTQIQDGENDIISAIDYDLLGREYKVWKPFVANTSHAFTAQYDDNEDSDGITESCKEYYDADGPGVNCNGFPFVQTAYGNDPLNRISRIGNPGNNFNINSGHNISYEYDENWDEVTSYTQHNLFKNTTFDENDNQREIYTDKFGHTVLERSYGVYNNTSYYSGSMDPLSVPITNNSGGIIDDDRATSFTPTVSCDAICNVNIITSAEAGEGIVVVKIGDYEGSANIWYRQFTFSAGQNPTDSFSFKVAGGKTYYVAVAAQTDDYLDITTCTTTVEYNNEFMAPIDTYFHHSILGNLEKIIPPKAEGVGTSPLCTSMKYNTLGQLVAKVTPDADGDGDGDPTDESISTDNFDYQYKYDNNGNIRFTKTAKGEFIYNKYDVFNRLVETGVYEGSTTFDNANASTSGEPQTDFPTLDKSVKIIYQYDQEPSWNDGTWPAEPQSPMWFFNNLKGKVSAVKYMTDGWAYTYYSYDKEGRIEWIRHSLPNLPDYSTIEYEYDLQGNIIRQKYTRAEYISEGQYYDIFDSFYIWYDYDLLGRLSAVYAGRSSSKSSIPVVSYTYWPTGQVNELIYGDPADPLQTVSYDYNSRDWVSQIGSNLFTQKLGYQTAADIASSSAFSSNFDPQYNGNISWMSVLRNSGSLPLTRTGLLFDYDFDNRLTNADFGYYDTSQWANSVKYDVSTTYDLNGNLLTLSRQNNITSTAAKLYNYIYYTNSNRLKNVSGTSTIKYSYDREGNLTFDDYKNATINYDYRNLPYRLEVPGIKVVGHYYDDNGQRVIKKKSESSVTP